MQQQLIPAFVNAKAGTATEAQAALEKAGTFDVQIVQPDNLVSSIREAIQSGSTRILVSGGDGTIATAASVLAGKSVELAILPGGTLNHFAKDNGIPTDLDRAIEVAGAGQPKKVDVAYVGEKLFLNTSSIGAYVKFVRVREQYEKRFGYGIATFLAFVRILSRLHSVRIDVEVDGKSQSYRSPMVFIGVGQRELKMPMLGGRVPSGNRGLQVIVVRGSARARLLTLAFSAVAHGTRRAARTPHMDGFMVDHCTIDLGHGRAGVAVDGEIVALKTPLEYRIERDALTIVAPSEVQSLQESKGSE